MWSTNGVFFDYVQCKSSPNEPTIEGVSVLSHVPTDKAYAHIFIVPCAGEPAEILRILHQRFLSLLRVSEKVIFLSLPDDCVTLLTLENIAKRIYDLSVVLKNKIVCSTGLDASSLNLVQRLCRLFGAVYQHDLTESCNFLIVGQAGTAKHRASLKKENFNEIECISLDWLISCFFNQNLQPCSAFPILAFHGWRLYFEPSVIRIDDSFAFKIRQRGGAILQTEDDSITHIVSEIRSEKEHQGRAIISLMDLYAEIGDQRKDDEHLDQYNSTEDDLVDLVKKLDEGIPTFVNLFEPIVAVIVGYPSDMSNAIRHLLLCGGGTRAPILTLECTHAIISPSVFVRKNYDLLNLAAEGIHVVDHSWVVSCWKQGVILPPSNQVLGLRKEKESAKVMPRRVQPQLVLHSENFSKVFDGNVAVKSPQKPSELKLKHLFFSNKTFSLDSFGLGPSQRKRCHSGIITCGGVILNVNATVKIDYHVCDFARQVQVLRTFRVLEKLQEDKAADTTQPLFVTCKWVESCVQEKMLIPPTSSVLYLTLPVRKKIQSFKDYGIVISVTQFTGDERTFLSRVAKNYGARFSERLSKRNTHLIVRDKSLNKENPKFVKADEWSIPIVHWSWLYDSILNAEPLSLEAYQIPYGLQRNQNTDVKRLVDVKKTKLKLQELS